MRLVLGAGPGCNPKMELDTRENVKGWDASIRKRGKPFQRLYFESIKERKGTPSCPVHMGGLGGGVKAGGGGVWGIGGGGFSWV